MSWGPILEKLTFELGMEEQGRNKGKGITGRGHGSRGAEESKNPEWLSCDKLPGIIRVWRKWQKTLAEGLDLINS